MMTTSDVLRLLRTENPEAETTQPQGTCSLEEEYLGIVLHVLARLGIPPQVVSVEIVSFSCAPDGRQAYGALLRLVAWDKPAVLRLLLGHGLLEAKVRKILADSWLPEVSLFAGLWVRLSSRLSASPAGAELKTMVAQMTACCRSEGGAVARGPHPAAAQADQGTVQ